MISVWVQRWNSHFALQLKICQKIIVATKQNPLFITRLGRRTMQPLEAHNHVACPLRTAVRQELLPCLWHVGDKIKSSLLLLSALKLLLHVPFIVFLYLTSSGSRTPDAQAHLCFMRFSRPSCCYLRFLSLAFSVLAIFVPGFSSSTQLSYGQVMRRQRPYSKHFSVSKSA